MDENLPQLLHQADCETPIEIGRRGDAHDFDSLNVFAPEQEFRSGTVVSRVVPSTAGVCLIAFLEPWLGSQNVRRWIQASVSSAELQ